MEQGAKSTATKQTAPSGGTWELSSLTEDSTSGTENTRKFRNLPPLGSSQACDCDGKLTGAEYTFYCGCAAKVGGGRAHTCVCARARVRDRTSAKPCMLISLWTTFWNQSSGFCHLCVFPNTHRKYQYVWMYMGCVCVRVCYTCMSNVFFFYSSLLKVFPMDFMAALEKNLKQQPPETRRCTWIQDTRRANLSIK